MSAGEGTRSKSTLERIIETLASGLGNSIGWLAEHGVLFATYALIWIAVGAGLLLDEAAVSQAWTLVGGQNIVLQAALWVLLLPVMAGLWIWHTDWPALARVVLVAGLAGWNLLIFLPRRGGTQQAKPGGGDGTEKGG